MLGMGRILEEVKQVIIRQEKPSDYEEVYNIFHKDDESKTADWSMVRELFDGALNGISGTVDTI